MAEDAASVLRVPTRGDHKYSRGVVSLLTGSVTYPGAAVLSVEGAWRAGIGMVRWLGEDAVAPFVVHRRPETVLGSGRADAAVLGSGMAAAPDRDESTTRRGLALLASGVPAVIDAGALDLVPRAKGAVIVTPHDGELPTVRAACGLGGARDDVATRLHASAHERLDVVRETADALGGVVLLKGARTLVAAPGGWWTHIDTGVPWLATAGTGDVLAGTIGALLAGCVAQTSSEDVNLESLATVAATAAWLHGTAGRIAAGAGHPITALDVAEALPAAFAEATR